MAFESISKVKVACSTLWSAFTFDMDSNATPCEKLSIELQFDSIIIGLQQTLKCLDAEKLYRKDTLADI